MFKSKTPEHAPQGNAGKHLSYREAWERIKQAQAHDFYLEAVTIEESIITDRLISHLVLSGALEKAEASKKSFNNLIQVWRKHHPTPICQGEFNDLQSDVDAWRTQRNRIVHDMVKSHSEGEPDVMDFLTAAKEAAEQGSRLARAVSNWHKKVHPQRLPHRSSKWHIEHNQNSANKG